MKCVKLFAVVLTLLTGIVAGWLSIMQATPVGASGPTSLGRTPWQMYRPSPITGLGPFSQHGQVSEYASAPAVPDANAASWGPAPNGSTIGFSVPSRLSQCWTQLDFAFFQTLVDIPTGTTLSSFTIAFCGMDDGARVSIYNSANPSGLVIPGSYVFLGGSGTTNLATYVVAGETNRVVVTQVDDCPTGNNLQSATVVLNGTVVVANQAPTLSASTATVAVNEGQPASNTGSYSDPDTGDSVTLTASRGAVSKTGTNSGSWTWSLATTDGPAQSGPVTVTADDGHGHQVATSFTLTVNNVAPSLSVNVGATNSVYYVDWTAASPGGGTASGVINLPDGSAVNVTFDALNPDSTHSSFFGAQTSGGTNFWSPSTPYVSTEVPNAPPTTDILQLSGGNATRYRVTLSQPIVDPIMAIVSLGSAGNTMSYNFDSPSRS